MVLERGKKYKFKYFEFYQFDEQENKIEFYQPEFWVLVPKDYDTELLEDNCLLLLWSKLFGTDKLNPVNYIGGFKLRGKYKWELLEIEPFDVLMKDLKFVIESSARCWEHPKIRGDWRLKNYTEEKTLQIVKWEEYTNYEDGYNIYDVNLYYRFLLLEIYKNPKNQYLKKLSFEELKLFFSKQYNLNRNYPMKPDTLQNAHDYFMRDVLKLWK